MKKKDVLIVFASVVGALLLSLCLKNILEVPYLFSTANKNDGIQMSDLYAKIGDGANVRTLSKDIVIISTDGMSRTQMAELINAIDSLSPKVIGMDILFMSKQDGDEALVKAINASQRIVLPYVLTNNGNLDGCFSLPDTSSFYNQLKKKRYGAVNLEGQSIRSIIRVFKAQGGMSVDGHIPS